MASNCDPCRHLTYLYLLEIKLLLQWYYCLNLKIFPTNYPDHTVFNFFHWPCLHVSSSRLNKNSFLLIFSYSFTFIQQSSTMWYVGKIFEIYESLYLYVDNNILPWENQCRKKINLLLECMLSQGGK